MNTLLSHLQQILDTQKGITPMQVVFVDIEKYSKRTSSRQKDVIDVFSKCLIEALKETAREFIEYTQKKNVNFTSDIVKLPLGDGAAIVFPFTGPHNFHLFFAETLLRIIKEMNAKEACDEFITKGWCNCHSKFNLRVGMSAGDGIIYKDINDRFNVAGAVINQASRVVDVAKSNAILVSEQAYKTIIEFSEDSSLVNRFGKSQDFEVKHGMLLTVYKYMDEDSTVDEPSKPSVIFEDDFETPTGWESYGAGSVIHSSDYSRSGHYSLKKDANNDPHGGYKIISKPVQRGLIFSGLMYRPSDGGKNTDRLGIEDADYNGYGFYVDHKRGEFRIERRDKGRASQIVDPEKIDLQKVIDCWYEFLFQVETDGTLELWLKESSGNEIAKMTANDTRYATFDRIVVHGGYRYYVDDIEIKLLTE